MTLRSRLMIGLIATASFPVISFGTDAVNTSIGDMPPPPVRTESGSNDQRPQVSGSGMNISKPPKPPMGTDSTNDRLLLPAVQKRG